MTVICEYLPFGLPIGIKYLANLVLVEKKCRNHNGARFSQNETDKDIKKMKTHCALFSPFKINLYFEKSVISPFNSVLEIVLPKERTLYRIRIFLLRVFPY